MWIFALVIIFLALVFLWGRRDNHCHDNKSLATEAMMLPMMTAAMSNMQHKAPYVEPVHYNHNGWEQSHREHWDIERDTMTQFGDVKEKMAKQNWRISDAIKDSRHASDLQFASMEKQAAVNTGKILKEQSESERRLAEKIDAQERRRLEQENSRLFAENSQFRFHQHNAGPRVYDFPPYGPCAAV